MKLANFCNNLQTKPVLKFWDYFSLPENMFSFKIRIHQKCQFSKNMSVGCCVIQFHCIRSIARMHTSQTVPLRLPTLRFAHYNISQVASLRAMKSHTIKIPSIFVGDLKFTSNVECPTCHKYPFKFNCKLILGTLSSTV